jgi:hypothetical protein
VSARGLRRVLPCALSCAVCAALLGASFAVSAATPCPRGARIHWVADWCMASIGTDDEIAASDCIEREQRRKFASACSAKTYYKRALCRIVIANGSRRGSAARCVADPQFAGGTVRRGGVGGP